MVSPSLHYFNYWKDCVIHPIVCEEDWIQMNTFEEKDDNVQTRQSSNVMMHS